MTKTAAVHLTADEIDELFDAVHGLIRHWGTCVGCGDGEENARYARIVATLVRTAGKLENARDQMGGD
jgi:hypothetical protein